MVEVLTEELSFGRYKYGYGTEGSQVRKLIWISDYAYPDWAMATDFAHNSFWANSIQYPLVAGFPGYTYTRTGQVGFVNSAGNVEWFATNVPPILANIGYEAYGPATNEVLRSQEFDNASWTKLFTTVTANTVAAPDGTLTADTITPTAGAAFHHVLSTLGLYTGNVTTSVFLKAGTHRYVQVIEDAIPGFNDYQNFDLQTGTMGNGPATSAIIACSNGWYRCVLNGAGDGAFQGVYIVPVSGLTAVRAESYNAAGTETFYAWQAQQFQGAIYSDGGPIIPTAGAPASITEEILKFTDTVGADANQLFVWKGAVTDLDYGQLGEWDDGSDANIILCYLDATGVLVIQVTAANVVVLNQVSPLYTPGTEVVLVARRLGGNWRGGQIIAGVLTWYGADTAGAFPTAMTQAVVGQYWNGNGYPNDQIQFQGRKLGSFTTDASVLAAVAGL